MQRKEPHLIRLILWSGSEPVLVDYDQTEREHGKSWWIFGRKLKYSIDALAAFSYPPLRIASALGLLLAGVVSCMRPSSR